MKMAYIPADFLNDKPILFKHVMVSTCILSSYNWDMLFILSC